MQVLLQALGKLACVDEAMGISLPEPGSQPDWFGEHELDMCSVLLVIGRDDKPAWVVPSGGVSMTVCGATWVDFQLSKQPKRSMNARTVMLLLG